MPIISASFTEVSGFTWRMTEGLDSRTDADDLLDLTASGRDLVNE
jgi:hypothetical protein